MTLRTVLIANRGEIARRIRRTCHALGLRAVAVYSGADRDLPFVREADLALCIGEPAPERSYLNIDALLEAAAQSGADAIHPGYGFLAENATFAQRVLDAGLIWIGPPPQAIAQMGEKDTARALAVAQEVPVVPGFDESQDPEALLDAARDLGFPVLIKAVAGGGGRGMREVRSADGFPEALASAQREAASAFGNAEVFIERQLDRPRHVEVQILADAHGHCVHLFERDCSIQRRHQKIIEEAPAPGIDHALRARLGQAAIRIAEAVGYVGAGTVEFLLDRHGDFFFLEMNTRLQVEHPVTEAITGRDLVALQLAIAQGAPLPFTQDDLSFSGHAIEARLYAEDPLREWMPATGTLHRFDLPISEGIRIDAGVQPGDTIGPHYDSLLAKIIAWGPDRATATRRLHRALRRAWVPGVATNLPLLRQVLAHPAWERADLDTDFLAQNDLPQPPPVAWADGVIAATVWGWLQRRERWPAPAGWQLGGPAWQRDAWRCGPDRVEVRWQAHGPGLKIELEGPEPTPPWTVEVLSQLGDALTLQLRAPDRLPQVQTWRVAHVPDGLHTDLRDGDRIFVHTGEHEAVIALEPRFPGPDLAEEEPGSAHAPTPGTLTAVHVRPGDRVARGARLVTVEAMKMEHAVCAPAAGTVAEVRAEVGDPVEEGMLLVRLIPDDEGQEPEAG